MEIKCVCGESKFKQDDMNALYHLDPNVEAESYDCLACGRVIHIQYIQPEGGVNED